VFESLRRWRARRRFNPLLRMARELAQSYGGVSDHYTAGQVRRIIVETKLPPSLASYAAVAFAKPDAFAEIVPDAATDNYDGFRAEIAAALRFDRSDWTARDVLARKPAQIWSPSRVEYDGPGPHNIGHAD